MVASPLDRRGRGRWLRLALRLTVLAALGAAGCARAGFELIRAADPDTAADSAADAPAADAAVDLPDSSDEASADGAADAAVDGPRDASTDGAHDAAADGAHDAAADGAHDASADSTSDLLGPDATPGTHLWSRGGGGVRTDSVYGAAATASGVFVVGTFAETGDFGGPPLTANGPTYADVFVAGYAPADGAHRWSRRGGGSMADFGNAIAADASRVYITGSFSGVDADFGGDPMATYEPNGYEDLFVAAYQQGDGAHVWSRNWGAEGNDRGQGIAVAGGQVVVVGGFYDSADFGGGLVNSQGDLDVFIAAYDSATGDPVWSHTFGSAGTNAEQAFAVASDASGNLYVTGIYSGNVSFGGPPLVHLGGYDTFVVSFDSAGAHRWSAAIAAAGRQRGHGIAVADGTVYVVGDFDGTIAFGGSQWSAPPNMGDVFIAALDAATGTALWSRAYGGGGIDSAWAVAATADRIHVCGFYDDVASFGGLLFTPSSRDAFFASYTLDGTHVWSASHGGALQDSCLAAAATPALAVFGGSFRTTINLGGADIDAKSATYADGFVAAYAP